MKLVQEEKELPLDRQAKKQQTSSIAIADIISLQSTEGFWKDIDLIATLYTKDLQTKV